MVRLLLLLSLLFIIGCQPGAEGSLVIPPTDGTAEAAVGLSRLSAKSQPTPAPAPVGTECPACKGKGEIGDGTVMVKCKVCKGTGRVVSADEPPDVAEARIEEVAQAEPEQQQRGRGRLLGRRGRR